MKKNFSLALKLLCSIFTILSFAGCSKEEPTEEPKDDVIVLFTNDVHCGISENIGYAGLSAYKKDLKKNHDYVVLADCGDFSQGAYVGSISKGEYIVDIMNEVGYDYAIFGNHEFDYGTDQLKENVIKSNAKFLNCNLSYSGTKEDWLKSNTIPYEVATYGDIKVGFVGISTPWSIQTSTPKNFMEDGKFVWDFGDKNGAEGFYKIIQDNVDKCIQEGADYVVALSHLGVETNVESPFTSIEVVQNTRGIDVVLDAHTHVEASCWVYDNLDGENVFISSTGTKLNKIGQLLLTRNGSISVGFIDNYTKKDEVITNKINEITELYESDLKKVITTIDFDLPIYDSEGIRTVRSIETSIGDFVADAYRTIGNADIGMCNGGGIRTDFKKGTITFENIIAVHPFSNTICVVKVTGQEVLDMLEYFYRNVLKDYKKDGVSLYEDGNFEQVSGLKFTIDTSIEPSIVKDEDDAFLSVGSTRRIKDVLVLQDGDYIPLDPNKTYTLAGQNYMIKNGGVGMLKFLANHELVLDEAVEDYQTIIDYINLLNGDLSQYKTVDNRITII